MWPFFVIFIHRSARRYKGSGVVAISNLILYD